MILRGHVSYCGRSQGSPLPIKSLKDNRYEKTLGRNDWNYSVILRRKDNGLQPFCRRYMFPIYILKMQLLKLFFKNV